MKTLLIDNYDSFTFNIAQALEVVNGVPPIVIPNDACSYGEIESMEFDNIVISPGPGSPARRRDFGICREVILGSDRPILGICMGFQGIALLSGARVVPAPEPWHGRGSLVRHDGIELFEGVPSPFFAIRYHSLYVPGLEGTDLVETARTEAGILMAFRHVSRPVWGVQFHPESIATESGERIFENFRALTARWAIRPPVAAGSRPSVPEATGRTFPKRRVPVLARRVEVDVDPETVFMARANRPDSPGPVVWLDSSQAGVDTGRFSFITDLSGPDSALLLYRSRDRRLEIREDPGPARVLNTGIFEYLRGQLEDVEIEPVDLPFQFRGGFVGYFGYELKGECGASVRHQSELPDAAFLRVSRFVAFDHERREWWVVGLESGGGGQDTPEWVDATAREIVRCASVSPRAVISGPGDGDDEQVFFLEKDRGAYLDAIDVALENIRAGESYQVCLTNRVRSRFRGDPVALYRAVRRTNPAPFAAFMRFDDVSILSSSPERFLQIDREGRVEARPIKGTASRASDPEADLRVREALICSEKNRSENLMIVDLLRNDLGKVAAPGSVRVPSLMAVESYETVHHLVSTVEARLGAGRHAVDCVRAAFPGGSMTGAPKIRTMEIIDELEASARGVYAGALGYLSFDGSVDLSIVIRTIVLHGEKLSIGTGGGIVALSNPRDEFDEAMVKARVLVETVRRAGPGPSPRGRVARSSTPAS